MKNISFLYLFFLLCVKVHSQNIPKTPNIIDAKGLRQGEWLFLYDEFSVVTEDVHEAVGYEIKNYKDGKITGLGSLEYGIIHPISNASSTKKYKLLAKEGDQAYRDEKYKKALQIFIEIKKNAEKEFGTSSLKYANACRNIGYTYQKLKKLQQAKKEFLISQEVYAKLLGTGYVNYELNQVALEQVYRSLGEYSQANALKKEIDQILKRKDMRSQLSDIELYDADSYFRKGDLKKAETLYQKIRNTDKQEHGEKSRIYIESSFHLANFYAQNLNTQSVAYQLYEEVKDLTAVVDGKNNKYYHESLYAMAKIKMQQEQYVESEQILLELKSLLQMLGYSMRNNILERTLHHLAWIHLETGKYTEATAIYSSLLRKELRSIESVFALKNEKERMQLLDEQQVFFSQYYKLIINQSSKNPSISGNLYNLQLFTKSFVFNSLKKMQNRILNSGNEDLIQKYESWKLKREAWNKLIFEKITDEKQRQSNKVKEDALQNEIEEIERQLYIQSKDFAKEFDTKRYTWQDVQKALKTNEVAIEILRTNVYDKKWLDSVHYVALIVTPESKYPEMVLLKNGKELETDGLIYYKNCIKLKKEDKESYQKYWSPFNKVIRGAKKVYFSGDGVYHQISLLGLKNTETQKYLSEEIDIQLVGNTKDLVTSKPSTQSPKKINILAYPDYKKGSKNKPIEQNQNQKDIKRFFEGTQISMLPGTQTEANQIEKTFQSQGLEVQKFLLEQASEENLKKLETTDILHIATHGFFMEDIPENINENKGAFLNNTQKLAENPLLRSGLLLAGAEIGIQGEHGSNEDGILTAYEAQNLNLDNTQLVVLSACETGQGEIKNGEGVFGLQRAFQTAGAKSILISLWKVDDSATQELMSAFYENWIAKKMNKRDAFKKSQEEIKKKYTHPYYWAAFVLIGE